MTVAIQDKFIWHIIKGIIKCDNCDDNIINLIRSYYVTSNTVKINTEGLYPKWASFVPNLITLRKLEKMFDAILNIEIDDPEISIDNIHYYYPQKLAKAYFQSIGNTKYGTIDNYDEFKEIVERVYILGYDLNTLNSISFEEILKNLAGKDWYKSTLKQLK